MKNIIILIVSMFMFVSCIRDINYVYITTKDDINYYGILVSKDDTEVVIELKNGDEVSILRSDINSMRDIVSYSSDDDYNINPSYSYPF